MTEAGRKSAATAQESERARAPGPLSAMAPEQELAQALERERARVWVPVQAPQLQERNPLTQLPPEQMRYPSWPPDAFNEMSGTSRALSLGTPTPVCQPGFGK